jgi:hypothetical protein
MQRFIRVLMLALVCLILPLAVASAQGSTVSRTKTEAEINGTYRVTNPWRRAVSNVVVDLQPGQVVISSTHTYRRAVYEVVAVFTPSITNGRIYWTLASATANGEALSQGLIDQVNASISTSWRNYVRQQAGAGRVQSITVTDTDLTWVVATGR